MHDRSGSEENMPWKLVHQQKALIVLWLWLYIGEASGRLSIKGGAQELADLRTWAMIKLWFGGMDGNTE
jgi:hypothetical protein